MIREVFERFRQTYGNNADTAWHVADPEGLLRTWARSLAGLGLAAVDFRTALDTMDRHWKEFPPTLPQFKDHLTDARRRRLEGQLKLPGGPREPMPEHVRAQLQQFFGSKVKLRAPEKRATDAPGWLEGADRQQP